MKVIAFDLDDTLFDEIDFVHSSYRKISAILAERYDISESECYNTLMDGGFDKLLASLGEQADRPGIDLKWCIDTYRTHYPDIALRADAKALLQHLSLRSDIRMALITDGRQNTQGNKIKALGLNRYISPVDMFISEVEGHDKTSPHSFETLMNRYGAERYAYVGDNPAKDFVQPNRLGWTTIGLLDRGNNIHSQSVTVTADYQPKYWVKSLSEISEMI